MYQLNLKVDGFSRGNTERARLTGRVPEKSGLTQYKHVAYATVFFFFLEYTVFIKLEGRSVSKCEIVVIDTGMSGNKVMVKYASNILE